MSSFYDENPFSIPLYLLLPLLFLPPISKVILSIKSQKQEKSRHPKTLWSDSRRKFPDIPDIRVFLSQIIDKIRIIQIDFIHLSQSPNSTGGIPQLCYSPASSI